MLHLLAESNGASTLHLAKLSFDIAYPACERRLAPLRGVCRLFGGVCASVELDYMSDMTYITLR